MKLLGYFVLIVGIYAICLPSYPAGKKLGALEERQVESMPQQETYSRSELLTAMNKFAVSIEDASSALPIGRALVILVGGIMIDVGSRRKKQPNTASDSN
jgi:hypothetical protein